MRPRTRILLLVVAVLFLLVNVGGAVMAMRAHEVLHTVVHCTLAVTAAYLLPHLVRGLRPSRATAR